MADKLEDQKIIDYERQRDANIRKREEEAKAERQRCAHSPQIIYCFVRKEDETNRLRASQEKAQDKRSEMDALRAKRAMEAAERQARHKEEQGKAR